MVIGAAGWGKTTAVAAWSRNRQTAWLRYEGHEAKGHEAKAAHLLAALLGALRSRLPGPAPSAAAVCTDQAESTVEALCAWLRSVLDHDLMLVLDDLHGLPPHSEAAAVIESLCQRAPERLHVILISRSELPFSLQQLRGRGLVAEIHAPDLAFDVTDIEEILGRTVGGDPPGLPRHVWEHTAGWPTAVQSTVEMLRGTAADQRLATVGQLTQPGQRFHDYLGEEVLGTAPEWVHRMLRRLAIFGEVRFATEIAQGLNDPTSTLAELSRQGLVRRTGDGAGWALVRPLQDFYEHQPLPAASERTTLHMLAASECLAQHAPADALRHLLAAGEHAASAALLIDHGSAMVESGQLGAVLEAAELPAAYLDDPRIQQVLRQAQQVRGQWARALQHFTHASGNQDELEPARSWQAGLVTFAQGEFAEVQALTRRTRLDREDTLDETRVLVLSAKAYRMTGDLVTMRRIAGRAQAAARRCGDPRAWSGVHDVFALLAAAEGDWPHADTQSTAALHSAQASADLLQQAWTRAWRAFYRLEGGAPREALADSEIAWSLGEQCEDPFLTAHALTTRGRARGRLGILDAAAADFATAIDLFQHIGSRFLAWPLCGLGDLHRTRGQLVRSRAAYEEALSLAQPHHDVFGLSSALIGLARIAAAEDLPRAREQADRAVELHEGLRTVPALLTRGWVQLMGSDRHGAAADAHQAAVAAQQRRDNPGLAEAITLSVLASGEPAAAATPLREAIGIWQEAGCRLAEAATRIVADRIGAPIPDLGAYRAEQILRDHGVDVESRVAGPLGVLVRSSHTVSIQTLGTFRVTRDGTPIPNTAWQSKKARELLKILVARRRSTPRDQLMELLWPRVGPVVGSNRLSVLLSTVRQVLQPHPLGEPALTTIDGAVALNSAVVSVDVEDFLTRATDALDADRAREPDATARLNAAIAAHTGGFLEDDPYQEWATTLAEEVRATHIALLRALCTRLRAAGDTDAVVRCTLRLLEHDRYDEDAYRSLIGVLLDGGRLGEARRHHQNYVRRMTEIDVQPSELPEMTSRGQSRRDILSRRWNSDRKRGTVHSSIQRIVLPDGRDWWSPKKSDTVFVWRELYENTSYERAKSVLQPGELVLDVGAHTGLSALYFTESQPGVIVHAFEPAPALYECLKLNLGKHAPRAQAHHLAIAETARRVAFTYYPNAPSHSGLYADAAADNATSIRYLVNLGMEQHDAEASCAGLHDAQREVVEAQPLSAMIAALGVSSVGLLKIDVERAELDVLHGIQPCDWPRIKSVIMEVHDIGNRLSACSDMLRREGYSIEVSQDSWLKDSELYSLFAVRESEPAQAHTWEPS